MRELPAILGMMAAQFGDRSEFVGVLSHGEAREGLARALSDHLDAKNGGSLLASRTKDGESGKGFAIKPSDEEALLTTRLFPNLANLHLGNRHL
jgi:hypothetical protein